MRCRAVLLCLVLAAGATQFAEAAQTALRVGAAKIDQTGPLGPSQTGKYDHEKVYARAIVLDNGSTRAALISYEGPEAAFDMAATRQAVATALGCPLTQVLISHTHTHSSLSTPSAMPDQGPKPTGVSRQLLDAVNQARAKLQPARMTYATGALYLNVNRDAIDPDSRKWVQGSNLDAPTDKTVGVLTFLKPNGEPIAAYVNYAMHPIDGYVVGVVDADFPGAMSRYVEKAFGDNIIVAFTQGTSGDVNPLYLRPSTNAMASRDGSKITGFQMNREQSEGPLRVAGMAAASHQGPDARPADRKAVDDLFRFIESEGQIFGEEVIRVMTFSPPATDNVRIAGQQQDVSCPGRIRTNGNAMDPATREGMGAVYKDAPPVQLHIGVLGLGNVALASINGEAYTAIGQHAKQAAPMHDTMIVTLANERVGGYIPDDASYGHETFQVLGSFFKPGCAETGIVSAVAELETRYLRGN